MGLLDKQASVFSKYSIIRLIVALAAVISLNSGHINTRDSSTSGKFGHINAQNNTIKLDMENCKTSIVSILNDLFIPIFVMTRDRITSLKTVLDSYQHTFNSPYEIILLDHNSTYPPMLQYLHKLKIEQNISVIPLWSENWKGALLEVRDIIQDYLSRHPGIEFYVFTDPDIAFLRTAQDILLFYAGVLQSCPEVKVVGPSLQISDIPACYDKGTQVFEWERRFWKDVPSMAIWNGVGYHLINAPIDTTFAMFRRSTPFTRQLRPSLRAYSPYGAVHVDWYYNSSNYPEDKIFYLSRAKTSNW